LTPLSLSAQLNVANLQRAAEWQGGPLDPFGDGEGTLNFVL
jgi:hypothetical protein